MRVRYTSTVFLFYSTNLAKIKAYWELPTSAKSLQKVLFLNMPYVILNTKKSQSSFSGKTDFFILNFQNCLNYKPGKADKHLFAQQCQFLHPNQTPASRILGWHLPFFWSSSCPCPWNLFKKPKSPIKWVLLGSHNWQFNKMRQSH